MPLETTINARTREWLPEVVDIWRRQSKSKLSKGYVYIHARRGFCWINWCVSWPG